MPVQEPLLSLEKKEFLLPKRGKNQVWNLLPSISIHKVYLLKDRAQ